MSEFLVVYITASGENATDLASALVREKLAACVNRIPGVESIYTWDGRVERDTEDLLIVKTRAGLFDRLKERVQALHAYDVPEIIAVPIVEGSEGLPGVGGDFAFQEVTRDRRRIPKMPDSSVVEIATRRSSGPCRSWRLSH